MGFAARALGIAVLFTGAAIAADLPFTNAPPPPAAPSAALADAPASEPGLQLLLDDGTHKVWRIVATPDFSLKASQSLHPSVGPQFTAQFYGALKCTDAGAYRFYAAGAKLKVDQADVGDGEVKLAQGDHELLVEYTRPAGAARFQLEWEAAGLLWREPIPASAFSHKPPGQENRWPQIEMGRDLVESLNCAACHSPAGTIAAKTTAPELSAAGSRLKAAWIAKWIENPSHFRATALMPAMLPDAKDRADAAAYLATLHRDRPQKDDKSEAWRIKAGEELFKGVGCANCHFEGGVQLTALGSKYSQGELRAYLENPADSDKSGRMPSMLLSGGEAAALADYLTQPRNAEFEAESKGDAAHGKAVVESAGCMACHSAKGVESSAKPAPALMKLRPAQGCLADNVAAALPRFALTDAQRAAIRAFVGSLTSAPPVHESPTYAFERTVQALRCVACHELNAAAPQAAANEKLPLLTGAGWKLRRDWMNDVLVNKRRSRPWLKTRMPDFGKEAVGRLADAIAATCGADDTFPAATPTRKQMLEGQRLVGTGAGAMSCVTCHSFRDHKVTADDAARAPELTTMSSRLRGEWFARWMHEPARIQPGTAMPSFFLGKTDAESRPVISLLWSYFSLGNAMPSPLGIESKTDLVISVTDRPLVMRGTLPDPTGANKGQLSHGIAVGLPGSLSYGFDAAACELRMAWAGGFIDMKEPWSGRGGGQLHILGNRFITLPANVAGLRIGDRSKPAQKRSFEGYAITKAGVELRYALDGAEVRETISATDAGLGLVRRFTVDSPADITFVATEEPGIAYASDNGKFEPFEVELKGRKVVARMLQLPRGKQLFTITITAKEGK